MASYYDGGMGSNVSSSSSSESEFPSENLEDLSYGGLQTIPTCILTPHRMSSLHSLQLDNNDITSLPTCIGSFKKLIVLNISSNNMTFICDEICQLPKLRTLIAKNNKLTNHSFPKDFGQLKSLEVLNVSGNHIDTFPPQFTELGRLEVLHFGANQITSLPGKIRALTRLKILYLGGNQLTDIPADVGCLSELSSLALCDNKLQSIPPTLSNLTKLRSLSLHSNLLATLPSEIVSLNLTELSLRKNPLVNRFIQDLVYNPPSLLELAGRCVKVERVAYSCEDLPVSLMDYLDSAQRCVNPKCKGVYFSSRFEHVKFVDFCGKYRLPLLQYLCSPSCTAASSPSCSSDHSDGEEAAAHNDQDRMRRVLLG